MENQNLPKVLGESIKNWLSSENQKWHEQQKQFRYIFRKHLDRFFMLQAFCLNYVL